jgi:hypothetical protein
LDEEDEEGGLWERRRLPSSLSSELEPPRRLLLLRCCLRLLRCRRSPSLPFLLLLDSDPYDIFLLGSFSSDPLRLTRSEEAVNPASSGSGTYLDFLGEDSESLEFRPRDWEREWLREPRSSSSSEVSLERLLLLRGMRRPTTKRQTASRFNFNFERPRPSPRAHPGFGSLLWWCGLLPLVMHNYI